MIVYESSSRFDEKYGKPRTQLEGAKGSSGSISTSRRMMTQQNLPYAFQGLVTI